MKAGGAEAEGVGEADAEGEVRGDVDGLGDLRVGPAGIADGLHLRVGDRARRQGEGLDEVEQGALGRCDRQMLEVTVAE